VRRQHGHPQGGFGEGGDEDPEKADPRRILIDQNVDRHKGSRGFFTRKAYTTFGIARLALAMDAAIHPAFIFRDPGRNSTTSSASPPLPVDPGAPREEELRVSPGLQRRARKAIRRPRPVMWFHRRWKTRPSGSGDLPGCNEGIVFLTGRHAHRGGRIPGDPSPSASCPARDALRLLSRERFLSRWFPTRPGLRREIHRAEMERPPAVRFRVRGGGSCSTRSSIARTTRRDGGSVSASVRMPEAGDGLAEEILRGSGCRFVPRFVVVIK